MTWPYLLHQWCLQVWIKANHRKYKILFCVDDSDDEDETAPSTTAKPSTSSSSDSECEETQPLDQLVQEMKDEEEKR